MEPSLSRISLKDDLESEYTILNTFSRMRMIFLLKAQAWSIGNREAAIELRFHKQPPEMFHKKDVFKNS